jgi:hypothetical protein
MARASGLPAFYELDKGLVEARFRARLRERDHVVAGRQRVAAATLLLLAGGLFMTPPAVAVLVLAGLLR